MKKNKSFLMHSLASLTLTLMCHSAIAQPTTYGTGAGTGGNITNTYLGAFSGTNNTASFNTFTGYFSGNANTTGSHNTFLGHTAGSGNLSGTTNTFLGFSAGSGNTTGSNNIYIGQATGYQTNGSGNTYVGTTAGVAPSTGNNNTLLGYNAVCVNNPSNATAIGFGAWANTSNTVILGNNEVRVGIGLSNPSRRLTVNTLTGNDGIRVTQTSSGYSGIELENTSSGGKFWSLLSLGSGNSQGSGNFLIYNATHARNDLIISGTTGGVGIGGTTNPLMKLDIYRGDMIFTGNATRTYRFHYQYWLPNGELFLSPADGSGNMIATGLVMGTNGHVGVGTSSDPTHRLNVNGSVIASAGYFFSDERFKKDISHVDNAMELISSLEGVRYLYKENIEIPDTKVEGKPVMRDFPKGMQLGLIAQDVEKVLPEVVVTGADGYKAVAYQNIIPVLIEGIKEQQRTIEAKDIKINELESRISKLEEMMNNSGTGIGDTEPKGILFQNNPNPFNGSTEIRYSLPQDYSRAEVMIFDMNGKKIKAIALQGNEGIVTVSADELQGGMYLYSLVLDGQVTATKRMLVNK